jgi:predicted secreted protein
MAETDAHIGQGAQIQKGDGASPENFVAVLGVTSITGPNIQREAIDVTDMDSGTYRKFIGGLVDAGEVSFEANFLPRSASQNQESGGFMAEFDKHSCNSAGNWRIALPPCEGEPDGYFQFSGDVTGQQIQMPGDAKMSFSGSIKVSGRPVLTIEEE